MNLTDPFDNVSESRRRFMIRVQRLLFSIGTAGVIGATIAKFAPRADATAFTITNGNNTLIGGIQICDCTHPNGSQPCQCNS